MKTVTTFFRPCLLCIPFVCMAAVSAGAFAQQENGHGGAEVNLSTAEVLGLHLGMAPQETFDLLKRRPIPAGEHKFQVEFIQLVAENPSGAGQVTVPNGKYVSRIANGETGRNSTSPDHGDRLSTDFTPTPGNERLAAIYRHVGFPTGLKPTRQNTLNDLTAKYGAPTAVRDSPYGKKYFWAFDGHETLMKSWPAGNVCQVQFPEPDAYVRSSTSPQFKWANALVNWHGKTDYVQTCGRRLLTIDLQGSPTLPFVDSMQVSFIDIAAVIAGQSTASALIVAARQGVADRDIRNAGQVKAPEL